MLEDKEQDEPLLSRMCERGASHPLLHVSSAVHG